MECAGTGAEALAAWESAAPDVIVLDLGLPDLEGGEVCRRIRTQSEAPIIVLSAHGGEADKIAALDLGADDYVTKPFGPEELLARVRVAVRRVLAKDAPRTGQLRLGNLTIDFDRHRLLRDMEEIRLAPKEFQLLTLLARRPNCVVTHHAILAAIWSIPLQFDQRSVRGHRRKSLSRKHHLRETSLAYILEAGCSRTRGVDVERLDVLS